MKVSVIISTYNSPAWLAKVLWGYSCQDHGDMEVVVADDGSRAETRALIDEIRAGSGMEIVHVWHEDRGFQKSEILNRAVVASSTGYLIFSDGDCIPRRDFVSVHVKHAEPGHMLSGGYVKLPMDVSERITKEDVLAGRPTDPRWLRRQGAGSPLKMSKLRARGPVSRLLNAITTTRASWNGHNSSGWKEDIVAVNGFDERMQYGGQDRELGERLVNAGIRPKQIRYSAVCVHLDHGRGYRTRESIDRNLAIRRETRTRGLTWTEYGIRKGARPGVVL